MTETAQRPLQGVRVVGLEQYISGPYCTMLLADAGAEVIKIERPGTGDPRRAIAPFVEKNGVKKAAGFLSYNRNKKSLALNLASDRGRQVLRRLIESSDVVVENLRPGATAKMGLDYESLKTEHPRLIYATISGFGRLPGYETAYSRLPSFDIVAEAMSGVMDRVGFPDKPPTYTLYGLADIFSGFVAAYGIMQALFMRERTGQGQMVDSSMLDNMLAVNEGMVTLYSLTGQGPLRGKLKHMWPRGAFRCKDGYVALNVPDEIIWRRLVDAMERPDLAHDPRSTDGTRRAANEAYLRPVIETWMASKTRADVVDTLNGAGVPAGPVYTAADVFADDHFRKREALVTVNDPEVGPYLFARTPPHLSSFPKIRTDPAPNLGQDSRSILVDLLELAPQDVEELVKDGVVATSD